MEIQEHVRVSRPREHVTLDAAARADEERLNVRTQALDGARNREPGIEVPAGATAGEHDSHVVGAANGLEADTPITRSRRLPMFTRMPVRNIVSTRLERPYDTN